MGLRIVTLVVSIAGWLVLPSSGHASEPQSRPSTSGEPGAVETLPNTATYGPSRRGAWRIDANTPQRPGAWEYPAVEDPPPPPTTRYRRYMAHPYAEGQGYVLRGTVASHERPPGRLHTGQFALEGGQSGSEQGRASLALRVGFWRLGFDSNLATHFTGAATRDRPLRTALVMGNTNGLVAPVLHPKVMWWIGGGLNYAARSPGVGVGPNLTSTLDAFLRRPLVMSVRGDVGTVGGAPTVAGRGTLGFMLLSFELYVGYEARLLGDLLLQGPMVGARAWF